jgi:hypothetical protein
MTLGELSQRMMVSNGNVTGLVERLVRTGLIRRKPSPKDRRSQIVSLTAEGRASTSAPWRMNAEWVGEIFGRLSAGDIEALMALLGPRPRPRRVGRSQRGPHAAADPVTCRLSDYKAAISRSPSRQGRDHHAEPAGKKNPLTFESYAELVDLFRAGGRRQAVKAFVVTGAAATSARAATCSRSSSR